MVSSEKERRALFSYAAYIFICTYQRERERVGRGSWQKRLNRSGASFFLISAFHYTTRTSNANQNKMFEIHFFLPSTDAGRPVRHTTNWETGNRTESTDWLSSIAPERKIYPLVLFVDWQVPGVKVYIAAVTTDVNNYKNDYDLSYLIISYCYIKLVEFKVNQNW